MLDGNRFLNWRILDSVLLHDERMRIYRFFHQIYQLENVECSTFEQQLY